MGMNEGNSWFVAKSVKAIRANKLSRRFTPRWLFQAEFLIREIGMRRVTPGLNESEQIKHIIQSQRVQ